MERTKLIAGRLAKGQRENRRLSQQIVADEIGCSREVYSLWERGKSTPQGHWLNKLLEYYEVTNPGDLDIYVTTAPRRQVLQMIAGAGVAGALMSFGNTNLSPERFLSQANASISACWQLLSHGDYITIESILTEYVSTLESLARDSSRIQKTAAILTTQAKLLQIKLATRNHDFIRRQLLCTEAVQFGELSGDSYLHAVTLFWHGDTYVYCYQKPEEAIGISNNGMKHFSGSTILKSKLSMNLAIAEALRGDETSALNSMELAMKTIPKYPEQDPIHPYVSITRGKLEKQIGRVFLALAGHSPSYAKKAHTLFEESVGKCSSSNQLDLSQTLIHKADAACIIGDLHEYAKSLSDGMSIALSIGSKNQQYEAQAVLHKAPPQWQKEDAYQDLVKMF